MRSVNEKAVAVEMRSEKDLSLIAVFTTRTRSHSAMLVDLSETGAD